MKIWKSIGRRLSFAAAVIAALGAGMALGGAVLPETSGQTPSTPPDEELSAAAGNIGAVSVLPSTEVQWRYLFSRCGHERKDTGAKDVTGYTLPEIIAAYPDCRVTEMSAERAAIERILPEYCPDHYVLVWTEQETLCVFQTDETTLETVELMQLSISPESLDAALLEPLRDGMAFDSLVEINEYLEDAES